MPEGRSGAPLWRVAIAGYAYCIPKLHFGLRTAFKRAPHSGTRCLRGTGPRSMTFMPLTGPPDWLWRSEGTRSLAPHRSKASRGGFLSAGHSGELASRHHAEGTKWGAPVEGRNCRICVLYTKIAFWPSYCVQTRPAQQHALPLWD